MRVVYLCPFDLGRSSGTPLRARVTLDTMRPRVEAHAVALGAPEGATAVVLGDVWQPRRARPPALRLDRFARGALRVLRAFRPQVIHAFTAGATPPALLYRLRHPRVRLIFEMHGRAVDEMRSVSWPARRLAALLDWAAVRAADRVIAMSVAHRDFLVRHYRMPPARILISWAPVDLELFRYTPPPPPEPFVVGYAGNDHFWQGLGTVIAAAHLYRDAGVEFRLMGFPAERLRAEGLPNVRLLGVLPREALPAALGACHVLLSPRIGGQVSDLQFPFKLAAYLAAGRPVIGSAVSDQARILREHGCGVVIPPDDAAALVEAVRAVRALPEDARRAMGERARAFAEDRLGLDALAEDLLTLYAGGAASVGRGVAADSRRAPEARA